MEKSVISQIILNKQRNLYLASNENPPYYNKQTRNFFARVRKKRLTMKFRHVIINKLNNSFAKVRETALH